MRLGPGGEAAGGENCYLDTRPGELTRYKLPDHHNNTLSQDQHQLGPHLQREAPAGEPHWNFLKITVNAMFELNCRCMLLMILVHSARSRIILQLVSVMIETFNPAVAGS